MPSRELKRHEIVKLHLAQTNKWNSNELKRHEIANNGSKIFHVEDANSPFPPLTSAYAYGWLLHPNSRFKKPR